MTRKRAVSIHFGRWKVHSLALSRHFLPLWRHFEGFSRHSLLKMYCEDFLTRHSKLLTRHYVHRMARREPYSRHLLPWQTGKRAESRHFPERLGAFQSLKGWNQLPILAE